MFLSTTLTEGSGKGNEGGGAFRHPGNQNNRAVWVCGNSGEHYLRNHITGNVIKAIRKLKLKEENENEN